MHSEAVRVARGLFDTNPCLEDDMESYGKEIDLFFDNLIDYRAHLAHKLSEGNFDKKHYQNFDEIEVVVISDWKMKILSSKHREAQQGTVNDKHVSFIHHCVLTISHLFFYRVV